MVIRMCRGVFRESFIGLLEGGGLGLGVGFIWGEGVQSEDEGVEEDGIESIGSVVYVVFNDRNDGCDIEYDIISERFVV